MIVSNLNKQIGNKDVYAIFNDGAIIFNRDTKQLDIYGNVIKFSCKD